MANSKSSSSARNAQPTPTSADLGPGSLAIYENDGCPILAAVIALKKRVVVWNDRGREVELPAERLHQISLRLPPDCSSQDARTAFLVTTMREATTRSESVPVAEAWGLLKEDPREYSAAEISELCAPSSSPLDQCSVFLALVNDSTYFKRKGSSFTPRSESVVQQLLQAEQQRLQRREHDQRVVDFLNVRIKDRSIAIPDVLRGDIELLEAMAAVAPWAEQRVPEAETLLELCESKLNLGLAGNVSERCLAVLQAIGHITPRTNLAPLRHRLPRGHSAPAIAEAQALSTAISASTSDRVDLTALDVFTVDDDSTHDIDDGISLEQTVEGFRLGIHISDIAALVPLDSELDRSGRQRATSVYLSEETIHMLPESLSCAAGSLIPDAVRPSLSYLCTFDHQWQLKDWRIVLSVIRSRRRISYDQVDQLLDQGSDRVLNALSELATHLETKRIERGAIRIQKRDVSAAVDVTGTLTLHEIDENSPARMLVGELMILANSLTAQFCRERNIAALYRSQPAPDYDPRELEAIPEGPARDYAIRGRLKRSEIGVAPRPHASLGLEHYTQATSPIRRYADLIVQRQVAAALAGESAPYSAEALQELIPSLEETLQRATIVSRESRRFWLLRFLESEIKVGGTLQGIIVRIDPRFCIVELDQVFITAVAKIKNPELGATVKLRLVAVDPFFDHMRMEALS